MPSVDFQALKRLIPTIDFLRQQGWRPNHDDGREARGWCPLHSRANPKSRSFWVRYSDGWWYCHSCKVGGGVIELALHLLAPHLVDACVELCRLMGVAVPYLRRSTANRRRSGTGRGNVGGRGGEASHRSIPDPAEPVHAVLEDGGDGAVQ